jgi:hypothetical protein
MEFNRQKLNFNGVKIKDDWMNSDMRSDSD